MLNPSLIPVLILRKTLSSSCQVDLLVDTVNNNLLPGMQLNSVCQDVGFICPFVVIDPTDLGVTTAVAWNLHV